MAKSSDMREPEAFSLDPAPSAKAARTKVTVTETPDVFAGTPDTEMAAEEARSGWSFWTRTFWAALLGFVSLGVATTIYNFVVTLIYKSETLGMIALALAVLLVISLLVLLTREVSAMMRLGSARRMRLAADKAHASGDRAQARAFLNDIIAFYRKDPTTAKAREILAAHSGEIIDGPDLVLIAERELLQAKDDQVRDVIAQAASRVAMVTTISPRAWFDVSFVLAQSVMLISKVATIYSGRPGGFAMWRLSMRVASHLVVTGGVAVATDVVGQFFGAGLMARLSSKLGEGVLNGVLTARVGLSAIAVCRPMPFRALSAPALGDVAGSLLSAKTDAEKSAA